MNTFHQVSLVDSSDIDDKLLAFTQAAEEQRSYLKWVAARMITGAEDAEDIVQQSLLKAYVNLPRFRGDARMRTWLHTIVLNTAREHLRNQKRRVPLQGDALYEGEDGDAFRDLPHPDISPEDFCVRNEIGAIVHSEIDVLTPFSKRAVEMCVLRELPYRAVAKELKTNVATLKSRVYRAKGTLKRALTMRNLAPCNPAAAHARSSGGKGTSEIELQPAQES